LNIGSGDVSTIGEMAATMAHLLGGPPPVITGRYRLGDVRHITADCSAASRLLGWTPTIGLSTGLAALLSESLPV
jgi:dTDP-L-rhamnose 4-epimerase